MEKTKPFEAGAFAADLDYMSREGLAVLLAIVMTKAGLSSVSVVFDDILSTTGKTLRSRVTKEGFQIELAAHSGAVKAMTERAIEQVQAEHAAAEAGEVKH